MKVIVVGAGILGASTAWHLAREGAEVVLVDRDDRGRATAAGAGIVSPWGSKLENPAGYGLLADGARYYPELLAALAEDGETDVGYARVGALYVPDEPDTLDAAERRIRARAAEAPEAGRIERLAPQQAQALFPPLRPDLPGVFVEGGARVDGRLVAEALARAASRRGARRIEGSAGLLLRGDRVAGVTVGSESGGGETIEADWVVVAAGAWAAELLAPAGIALTVAPQRGQIVHLRRPGAETAGWPSLQPLNSYYLLAFADSRVVIGATRETGSGFDHRLTAAGVAEVLNAGLATAPGLADWPLHEIRIGFRPLAKDNRPRLGPAEGVEGLLIGNGLGAGGLTMGPFAGRLLAQAALGRETTVPLAPFDPLRKPPRVHR
ncbi:D-amino-acid dehydrogenase [Tistlia consotensis]|uniref:D-amino-acid dehydrogenase n=1 Tax=Tistlia consotensis USBA 355 TaxID=560819 RepID=A0A1Y6CEB1_9PROT|nr:FAD-binding oxidoreductase [Tistlia consotensis]SMF58708.1 D-amino-acid dehydrogenase [Tistlia consotensis USBA 355]SNR63682.1 D-amino-acid dehydrogenase [Tistlia consotensis]